MYLGSDIGHIGRAKGANEIQKKHLGRTRRLGRGDRRSTTRVSRHAARAMRSTHAQGLPAAPTARHCSVFFHDPNGIKIELNYAAAEAEGIAPELMASELIKA